MGENPRVVLRRIQRNAACNWQRECLSYGNMSAPLDLFADDVIRTAYTRLLPLTLIAGIAAVLLRAVLEKLIAFAVLAFRRKGVRVFVERLARAVTRFRSETAAPHQVQPTRPPEETMERIPGEVPAPH